jgi:hypothetical protein
MAQYHYSNWLVTINPNTHSTSAMHSRDLVRQLGQALEEMWGTHEHLEKIIEFQVEGHSYLSTYIQNIHTEFTVEVGKKIGRVHSHSHVHVDHSSNIKLSHQAIVDFIRTKLGVNPYVHIKFISLDHMGNTKNYLNKDPEYE